MAQSKVQLLLSFVPCFTVGTSTFLSPSRTFCLICNVNVYVTGLFHIQGHTVPTYVHIFTNRIRWAYISSDISVCWVWWLNVYTDTHVWLYSCAYVRACVFAYVRWRRSSLSLSFFLSLARALSRIYIDALLFSWFLCDVYLLATHFPSPFFIFLKNSYTKYKGFVWRLWWMNDF